VLNYLFRDAGVQECRRDKIRCDGARPCSGCLKKATDILCIDGCAPCRRAREVCDGRKPCRNCEERLLDCEEEATSPISRPEVIPLEMPPPVRAGERAKLACLACRRDNKKCGDQRPCPRCVSRSEECIHVGRGPKIVKSRCQACRDQNWKCEDVRPCRHCAELGVQCYDAPRKGRGHGTRVKAACIGCRRNKIQCGSERPCKSCEKRGLECVDRGCVCTGRTPGTTCHGCRLANGHDSAPFPQLPPPPDGAPSFLLPNHPANFDASFGFPQTNLMQSKFQGLPLSAIDIDPLLMGSSQSPRQGEQIGHDRNVF